MRTLVVAIPRLEGKCTEKYQKMGGTAIFGGNRYLVPFNRGIATPVCALARNDSVIFQTPIYRSFGGKWVVSIIILAFPVGDKGGFLRKGKVFSLRGGNFLGKLL